MCFFTLLQSLHLRIFMSLLARKTYFSQQRKALWEDILNLVEVCRFSREKKADPDFFFSWMIFFSNLSLSSTEGFELIHSQKMEYWRSSQRQKIFLFFGADIILAIAMSGRKFSLELLNNYSSYILFCRKGCTTPCHVPYWGSGQKD